MGIPEGVREREKQVRPFIEKYSRMFGINPHVLRGLITQESLFIADAESPTGAFGYGQFTRIACKQVNIIADMPGVPDRENLDTFTKDQANEPDVGIKAICATLWWLLNKKYVGVVDPTVRLEAAITFYNAGGKAAYLVVKHGGHANAVPYIKELPPRYLSQSVSYARKVSEWVIKWHEVLEAEPTATFEEHETIFNPPKEISAKHKIMIDLMLAVAKNDDEIDFQIERGEGFTEVSLIFPGNLEDNEHN